MGGNKKHEIIKVAQENLYMLKRLNERTSFYNVEKWNKDYEVSQYYKKNLCLYSPIDFNKTQKFGSYQQNPWGLETGSTPKKNYTTRKKFFSKTNYDSLNTMDIPEYRKFANSTRKRKKFEDFNYRDLELEEKKNTNKNKKDEEKIFKKISEMENVEPEQEQEKQPEREEKKDENKEENKNNNNETDKHEEKENEKNDKENEGQREQKQNNKDDKEERQENPKNNNEIEKNEEKNNN